jgi:DNA-binding transcriptional MerR regulator
MKTVGRNDPCPCGSGKKYKRCCLPEDERRAALEREAAPQPAEDAPAPESPAGITQLTGLLQGVAQTRPVLDYMRLQPEIEAAAEAIKAHRADFDKLAADEEAYVERTRALFAEERFAPLRFTADDVRRAFDKVGQPTPGSSNDQFVETALKAILHLADKDWRNQSAMSLLMHLPDYVAANRPLDAWIIQHCSYLTQEETNESNPFLFQMFSYGYDSWVAEKREREVEVLRQLGMDVSRLEHMSMEEIDAWLQDQQADPAKLARMEKLMLANPEQRAQAEANLEQLERDAHKLLERPDAAHLLVSPAQVQPWLPGLSEVFERVGEQFPDLSSPAPSPAASKAFMEAMFPLVREMVAELFTPERIGQLTAQLKDYRNKRFAAGDKKTAELANGALMSVRDECEPDCNRFICALGCLSLLRGSEITAHS